MKIVFTRRLSVSKDDNQIDKCVCVVCVSTKDDRDPRTRRYR